MKYKSNEPRQLLLVSISFFLSWISMPCMANDTVSTDRLDFKVGQNIFPISCQSINYAVPQSGLNLSVEPQLGNIAFIEIKDIRYSNNLKASVIVDYKSNVLFQAGAGNYSNGSIVAAYYFDEKIEKLMYRLNISASVATNIKLRTVYVKPSPEFAKKLDSSSLQAELSNQYLGWINSLMLNALNGGISKDAISSKLVGPNPPINMDLLCSKSELPSNNSTLP